MPIRILIAEDSPAVRTALAAILKDAGPWEIIDVENGRVAVDKAQELKPDLIILDLVMPVMDGFAAARQISRLLPEIPLLMHTMHWSPQVEIEAQKVGVRSVVSKSNLKLLIETVREVLQQSAMSLAEVTKIERPDVRPVAPPPLALDAKAAVHADKAESSTTGTAAPESHQAN